MRPPRSDCLSRRTKRSKNLVGKIKFVNHWNSLYNNTICSPKKLKTW